MTRSAAVDLGGLELPSPVIVAAGCAGTGRELAGLTDLRRIGAVVSRSVTVEARTGSRPPRIAETPAGVVWNTGLQNPGVDSFVANELPRLARGARAIVSIAGGTLEEYVRLTGVLRGRGEVAAIELYLSGPDEELGRPVLGQHADRVTEVAGAVARTAPVPVFAKIPWGADPVRLAMAAVRAGAAGVTLSGSPPASSSTAPSVSGWLAGPSVLPLTHRAVSDVARALPGVPIVASGGVRSAQDAIRMLAAGAWAVQVGTATLVDPSAPGSIARGIAGQLGPRRPGRSSDARPSSDRPSSARARP